MAKKNSRPNLAARKSASKKAEEKKIARQKAYWEAHRKQILIIAGIAVAAILALALVIDFFYVPAGSIRSFMGQLLDVQENAIIRELNDRYYVLGTMETPAGYAPADYGTNMTTDENETFFYFEAEEEGKAVNSAYVIGVKNRTAQTMIDSMSIAFNYEVQTENKLAQIGGKDVHYFYSKGLQSEETPDVLIANITAYVDTIQGSSILVSLASVEGPADELPSEEEMLADAEGIFASLTLPQ